MSLVCDKCGDNVDSFNDISSQTMIANVSMTKWKNGGQSEQIEITEIAKCPACGFEVKRVRGN